MDRKKKVAIIGTNGIPSRYGGFETLAEYLARNLNNDYDLYCYCAKTPKDKRLNTFFNTKLIYIPFKANGLQSMIYDAISIIHAFIYFDVLVILGFSGVFAFPLKLFFKRKKIVFNIGGIEWQKVRGKKAFSKIEVLSKKVFERVCIHFSDNIVVDNLELWKYVKQTYNIESVLAEYGGDHAVYHTVTQETMRKYPFLSQKYDFSISRAQEDMNIHILLDAYKNIPDRTLVVVSNWNTSEYGKHLKEIYDNKYPNIVLQDAIYQLDELNIIRSNTEIYFHTHSLCGTAPSLTEAMSLGLPVVCFDVATNRATTEEKSFYFKNSNELIEIIKIITSDQLENLGKTMKKIAQRRYTWNRIVQIYKDCIDKNY